MDLGKILEKKGLTGIHGESERLEDYLNEHFVEFKDQYIASEEYKTLKGIASALGKSIDDYKIGLYEVIKSKRKYIGNMRVKIEDNHITGLSIKFNPKLGTFPESVGNLASLEELYLCNNALYGLPETIGNLKELLVLHLGDNKLASLPDWIGKLTSLKKLGLQINQLNSLPESIKELGNLEYLDLSHNKLNKKSKKVIKSLKKRGVEVWT